MLDWHSASTTSKSGKFAHACVQFPVLILSTATVLNGVAMSFKVPSGFTDGRLFFCVLEMFQAERSMAVRKLLRCLQVDVHFAKLQNSAIEHPRKNGGVCRERQMFCAKPLVFGK